MHQHKLFPATTLPNTYIDAIYKCFAKITQQTMTVTMGSSWNIVCMASSSCYMLHFYPMPADKFPALKTESKSLYRSNAQSRRFQSKIEKQKPYKIIVTPCSSAPTSNVTLAATKQRRNN